MTELVGINGGDGGEVPGNQWEHAWRQEGDEPGQEGDRDRGEAHESVSPRTGRAPRRPGARAPGRAEAGQAGFRAGGSPKTSTPTASAPATSTPSGTSQARSPKPLLGGVAGTAGPNSATSVLDLLLGISGRDLLADERFMRCATGASDWSSVVSQTGQTSSASRSAAFGGPAPPPTAPRRARTRERAEESAPHDSRARSMAARRRL